MKKPSIYLIRSFLFIVFYYTAIFRYSFPLRFPTSKKQDKYSTFQELDFFFITIFVKNLSLQCCAGMLSTLSRCSFSKFVMIFHFPSLHFYNYLELNLEFFHKTDTISEWKLLRHFQKRNSSKLPYFSPLWVPRNWLKDPNTSRSLPFLSATLKGILRKADSIYFSIRVLSWGSEFKWL